LPVLNREKSNERKGEEIKEEMEWGEKGARKGTPHTSDWVYADDY